MTLPPIEPEKPCQPGGYCPVRDYPTDVGVCAECGRRNTFVEPLTPQARRRRFLAFLRYSAVTLAMLAGLVFGGRMAVYRWLPEGVLALMDDEWIGFAPDLAGRIRRFRDARESAYVQGILSRLEAEAAGISAGHPWAGVYEAGEIAGARQRYDELHLGRAGDAVYARYYYGRVTVTDKSVDCMFDSPSPLRMRWIRCEMGNQAALVAEQDIYAFLNAPDNGRWPPLSILYQGQPPTRDGSYFRWPAVRVPQEYERFRLRAPLTARITAVRDVTTRLSSHQNLQLEIDVGSNDGVFVGTPFWCVDADMAVAVGAMQVEALHAEKCWATVTLWRDPARPAPTILVDQVVISGRAETPASEKH